MKINSILFYNHSVFKSQKLKTISFRQVWFQNARAKWRRNVMRQEGSLMNPGGQPLGSLPSITTVSLHHHHHHFTSAMSGGGGVGVVGNNPSNTSSSDGDLSSNQALEEMHNMTFAELY